jgi:two-component sensor histidine kinase
MYVISSMLSLQADYVTDERALGIFQQMEDRIQSMALVHQKLYQSGNLSSIDLGDYIDDLVDLLLRSYKIHPNRIALIRKLESLYVLIDSAIPCGLIVNELISNALQHAFPEEAKGEIRVGLQKKGKTILLWVSDNGVGLPPEFDFRRTETLGLRTVLALGERQLKGTVEFRGEGGVTCQVQFQDTLYRARV